MKNFRLSRKLMMGAAVACALSVSMSSCSDDDEPDPVVQPTDDGVTRVTANISANTTWSKTQEYRLAGRIQVQSGATLTIEPGTVIKGEAGTGVNATALIVAQGGKIMAEGTAAAPIVFTSVADNLTNADIAAGNVGSPNLDADQRGLWGGVIILGRAPFIGKTSPTEGIEGISSSENAIFGGTDASDNSGIMKYVSIRHGGSNIGAGNEINGLTLGGVGSGTVLENIEIVGNDDDGIEFFGGTVSVTNLLVWNAFDDAVDTDYDWRGTVDNFIVVTGRDNALELDGPEDNSTAGGFFTLKNGTIVASDANSQSSDLVNMDVNTNAILENIHFTSVVTNGANSQEIETDNAAVVFTNVSVDVAAADLTLHIQGGTKAGITASNTASAPGKADASVFSWTWASESGGLSGL
jgi:hypothetical protein